MEDLTPQFDVPIASQEVTLPSQPIDTGGSTGGFMTSPNGLTSGQLSLNSAGETILVGSATAPLTGAGVFIGNAGDNTYDFRAGDPAGSYIHWDASAATLTIVGSITAVAGTIGGFNIGADYVRDVANSFGLASTVTGGDDVRFWAGDTFANRGTAPFRVTEAGNVSANTLTVTGATTSFIQVPLTQSLLAGEAITSGDPVSIGWYQSDGGILYDTSISGTTGVSLTSSSITIGSNSNRVLIVFVIEGDTSIGATATATFNGVSMTQLDWGETLSDSGQQISGASFILIAPATGSHTVVFTNVTSSASYYIFSYYNCAQTSQPNTHSVGTAERGNAGAGTNLSVSATPTVDACLDVCYGGSNTYFHGTGIGDSGIIIPTATYTVAATIGNGGTAIGFNVVLAPFTAPSTAIVRSSSRAPNVTDYWATTAYKNKTFIGFANANISAGVSGFVVLSGQATQGLSGLQVGGQYYLADAYGNLSLTPGTNTRKVAIGISSTSVLITNIW